MPFRITSQPAISRPDRCHGLRIAQYTVARGGAREKRGRRSRPRKGHSLPQNSARRGGCQLLPPTAAAAGISPAGTAFTSDSRAPDFVRIPGKERVSHIRGNRDHTGVGLGSNNRFIAFVSLAATDGDRACPCTEPLRPRWRCRAGRVPPPCRRKPVEKSV